MVAVRLRGYIRTLCKYTNKLINAKKKITSAESMNQKCTQLEHVIKLYGTKQLAFAHNKFRFIVLSFTCIERL